MSNRNESPADRIYRLEQQYAELRCKLDALEDTDEELRAQKDLLQNIFDHLPLMITVAGSNGRVDAVNRAYERTLGWTSDAIDGETVDSFSPDPVHRERAWSFIRHRKAEWTDFQVHTRDGNVLDTIWTSIPLADGRWVGIGQDITERKRGELTLRESEQRFRAIYEHGRMGIAVSDPEGRLLHANPAFHNLLGYTAAEMVGMDFRAFSVERDLAEEDAYIQAMLEGKRDHYEVEKRYIRKDGEMIWVVLSAAVLRDPEGRPAFGLAMIQDITERKRSEEAFRRTQAYLAEAESLSNIGSWAFDTATGEIIFWSQEHFRIFGFDPEAGLPATPEVFARVHPEDAGNIDSFERAVAEQRDHRAEYRIVLPDGTVRHILSIGHPVLNDAGELVQLTGVAMDVTARKRVETELQQSSSQLRALASQLNRVREDEGARIARELHDELGSSLTGLKWDLEEMEHALCASAGELNLEALRLKLQRMALLADRTIQTVKRISSELRPVILDDLGLTEAVEWQCQEFQSRTGIRCKFDSSVESFRPSREQATAIFRITQEALTNILRHAHAQNVSIDIEESTGGIVLTISDDGCGIRPEQVLSPLSLGLAGMRERALLLRGQMEISGRPGAGTTVKMLLPQSPGTTNTP